MVGHEFAFYMTLKPSMIKDLKIRCDYKEEFEFGGILEVYEITMAEDDVLMITGKFGVINLSISMFELNKIIKKKEVKKK